MRLGGSEYGKRNAKRLRKEMTPPEIGLWLALRKNEAKLHFRKQHAVHDYVLDFYCARAKLAIEVDGEAHALRGEAMLRWSPAGYAAPRPRPRGIAVDVLTPPSILAVLVRGYAPLWHPSAARAGKLRGQN